VAFRDAGPLDSCPLPWFRSWDAAWPDDADGVPASEPGKSAFRTVAVREEIAVEECTL
jgi:hypothetical protein